MPAKNGFNHGFQVVRNGFRPSVGKSLQLSGHFSSPPSQEGPASPSAPQGLRCQHRHSLGVRRGMGFLRFRGFRSSSQTQQPNCLPTTINILKWSKPFQTQKVPKVQELGECGFGLNCCLFDCHYGRVKMYRVQEPGGFVGVQAPFANRLPKGWSLF